MSPLKARIFDVIERAGSTGVTIERINALCFDGRATHSNVKTHLHQLDDLFASTDLRIKGDGDGMRGFYHLTERREPAA